MSDHHPFSPPIHRGLPPGMAPSALAPVDRALVLANVRLLEGMSNPLQRQRLLRGKNVALICASPDETDAQRFQRAATELGAHVSHLRPDLPDPGSVRVFRHTAQMLGRLYQAVECEGVDAGLVSELGRAAGIPVFDGLASARHPLAALAESVDGATEEQKRRLIVQAVLVSTIG